MVQCVFELLRGLCRDAMKFELCVVEQHVIDNARELDFQVHGFALVYAKGVSSPVNFIIKVRAASTSML
jgi:hypothetical protein